MEKDKNTKRSTTSYYEQAQEALLVAKELTTKDRKKLKSSTFCGPNRSFPVPDCKRVAAAKAYLGRSKFSKATKKKIAACINRKAKELGCKDTKKAKANYDEIGEFEYYIYSSLNKDERTLYLSEEFESTKKLVEESIKNPNAICLYG